MHTAFLSKEKFFKRLSKENYESYIQKFPRKCILLQKKKTKKKTKKNKTKQNGAFTTNGVLPLKNISGNQCQRYETSTPMRLMTIINMLYEGRSIDTVYKS